MKKITILAAAIAIFGLSSIEANAQSTTKPKQEQQNQSSDQLQEGMGQGQSSEELQQGQGQSSDQLQHEQGQSSDQLQHEQSQGQGMGENSDMSQEGMREVVTEDELPEAVRNTLESDIYQDWEIAEIHKVLPAASEQQIEGQTSSAIYEVTFVNAEGQKGVVRLDEAGNAASEASDE